MNKKKPVFSLEGVHKPDSWVLSTANVLNTDLFASGSYDDQIVLYQFLKESR